MRSSTRIARGGGRRRPPPLRQGRRAVLRPDLGAAQGGARQRSGCGALLARAHARRRLRSALHRAPRRAHGDRGHRPRRPARAARSRSMRGKPTSGWAVPKASSRIAQAVVFLAVRAEEQRGLRRVRRGAGRRRAVRHARCAAAPAQRADAAHEGARSRRGLSLCARRARCLRGGRALLCRTRCRTGAIIGRCRAGSRSRSPKRMARLRGNRDQGSSREGHRDRT